MRMQGRELIWTQDCVLRAECAHTTVINKDAAGKCHGDIAFYARAMICWFCGLGAVSCSSGALTFSTDSE